MFNPIPKRMPLTDPLLDPNLDGISNFFRTGHLENWSFQPGDSFAPVMGSKDLSRIDFVTIFCFHAGLGQANRARFLAFPVAFVRMAAVRIGSGPHRFTPETCSGSYWFIGNS